MNLPTDVYILFSFLNTQLRDTGMTLTEFCSEHELDSDALLDQMNAAGFHYDEAQRRFR